MKRFYVFLLSFLFCVIVCAQQENPRMEAFATSGASVTATEGGMHSWTLGQTAFMHYGGSAIVEEGVQQVFCIPTFDTIDITLCTGDSTALMALLPQDYLLPDGVSCATAGHFLLQLNYLTEGGCDSIVWLDVTVNGTTDTMVYAQASQEYDWNGQVLTKSDIYKQVLVGSNGCDSVVRMKLTIIDDVPIPVIYTFRNRVVMIDHNANGFEDVHYTYYRWYRNGRVVAEGPLEDSYQTPGSNLNGCFYLEVPTSFDMTDWVRSNTICIGATDIEDVVSLVQITMAPNPVRHGETFRVYIDADENLLHDAKLTIYNVHGVVMSETTARKENTITANFATGVYTVHVQLAMGGRWVRKIVVK